MSFKETPIPMRLHCPARLSDGSMCGVLHVDEGEFADRPHHTHACQTCGNTWRPALVPTVGVQFLPGFRTPSDAQPVGKIPSVGKMEKIPEDSHALGPCLIQEWEESEKGYGVRPDGFSIHRNEQDLADFIKKHWDALPDSAPDTYSRPSGAPRTGFLTAVVRKSLGSKNGVYVSKVEAQQCLTSKG